MKYLKMFKEYKLHVEHFSRYFTTDVDNIKDIYYKRYKGNVYAVYGDKSVGSISLDENYWSEIEYLDNDIRKLIENNIPIGYEFLNYIEVDVPDKGIATKMIEYALKTTNKKGLIISKLFIADEKIHHILRNKFEVDESIEDWYILHKTHFMGKD